MNKKTKSAAKQSFLTKLTSSGLFAKWFNIGRGIDWTFFILVAILVIVGLLMLYSASYPISYYESNDSTYLVAKQLNFAVIGFIIMIFVGLFDYNRLGTKKAAYIVLAISFILLTIIGIMAVAKHEVIRSIDLGFNLQASEISKFAVILFMAYIGSKYYGNDKKIISSAVPIFIFTAILLYLEPHYSAIAIIFMLIIVMSCLDGLSFKWLAIVGGLVIIAVAVLYLSGNLGYAMNRMNGWGQALTAEYGTDLYEDTRQTRNSMYAIGSGGLTGLGFGQSRQKYLFLSEPQNDFIFAIVCEELGFIGAAVILLLFAILVYRGVNIAKSSTTRFGALLGCGIMFQIAIQVILNMLVITDFMPNTGISLPFFSSGGSSLIMLMAEMGIVMSISRTSKIEKL